jgi:hypothetical protein
MFHTAEIMHDAGQRYRAWAEMSPGRFDRKTFAYALRAAWRAAKDAAEVE